jgi:hypothetical protein|tara:strand:+ start:1134 stop:1481 length:348 start_codon:yes stop_codon:yes gene_type:complete
MANPNSTTVHRDIGLMWDMISGTTTTIVKAIIVRGQRRVKNIVGTTTGANHDEAIRALSDAFAVDNALSNLDPNKDNIEGAITMRDNFVKDCDNSLRLLGKSLDGIKIQFSKVNP